MNRRIEEPSLDGMTVIHDRERNRQVMRVQGVVVLPVGAEVELMYPNVKATVIGVRLLARRPRNRLPGCRGPGGVVVRAGQGVRELGRAP